MRTVDRMRQGLHVQMYCVAICDTCGSWPAGMHTGDGMQGNTLVRAAGARPKATITTADKWQ